jgi:anthranilate synthase component 2
LCLLAPEVRVFRNDQVTVEEIGALRPSRIVISPGPKTPGEAGISIETIRRLGPACPLLGVCLGHQCINEAFGGATIRAAAPWHGKTSPLYHDGEGLYAGVPDGIEVARYHSLVADPERLGEGLRITARTADGVVMGLRHGEHPIEGVQFHLESFLTEHGRAMIRNWFSGARQG